VFPQLLTLIRFQFSDLPTNTHPAGLCNSVGRRADNQNILVEKSLSVCVEELMGHAMLRKAKLENENLTAFKQKYNLLALYKSSLDSTSREWHLFAPVHCCILSSDKLMSSTLNLVSLQLPHKLQRKYIKNLPSVPRKIHFLQCMWT